MTAMLDIANSTDTIAFQEVTADGELIVYGENDVANVFRILPGADGPAALRGGQLGDTLQGGDQGDVLAGRGGEDSLFGEGGDDDISGGEGNDNIIPGDSSSSTDIVSGGAGADLFVFEFFGDEQGNVIEDFSQEEGDRIYIEDRGYVDVEELGVADGEVTVNFDEEGNVSINGEELDDEDFDLI